MDISLPFGKFSSFQSLISQKQLREINLQMVSTISFGWFADFRKTLTIIFNGLPNWSTLTNGKHPLFTCCSLAILPYWTASKIYRQGKYVIRHTCLADNFEKKPMWIPGERWSVCNPLAELDYENCYENLIIHRDFPHFDDRPANLNLYEPSKL